MSKNKMIVAIVMVAVLAVCAFFLWQTTPKEESEPGISGLPMKIARYYWPGTYWVDIAEKKGWFREVGLNVEIIDTNPDYFKSLEDMVAGKMDQNNFPLFDLIYYLSQGNDLVFILNTDNSSGMEAIVSRPGIELINQLKGKKIAVTIDSFLEYELDVILRKQGLLSTDVIKIDMPGENMVKPFAKGEVDAMITWEPLVTEAVEKQNGIRLIDTSHIPGISPSGSVFHRSFIRKRPGDIRAYVRVWHRTTRFIKENPKEAFGIIAAIYKKTPQEVQALAQRDEIRDLEDNRTAFSYGSGLDSLHGSWKQMNNFMVLKKTIKERLNSADYLDSSWIRNLEQPGK